MATVQNKEVCALLGNVTLKENFMTTQDVVDKVSHEELPALLKPKKLLGDYTVSAGETGTPELTQAYLNATPGVGINESVDTHIDVDGEMKHRYNSEGKLIHHTDEGIRNFHRWFGNSKVIDDHGRPLVVYHGTNAHVYTGGEIESFHTNPESGRGGAFFTSNKNLANEYGEKVYNTYLNLKNPLIVDAQGNHWTSIPKNSPISGVPTEKLNTNKKKTHDEMENIAKDMGELLGEPYSPREFHPIKGSLDGRSLKDIPGIESHELETDQITKAAKKNGFDGVIFNNVKDSPTSDKGYSHGASNVYSVFNSRNIKSASGNNGEFSPSSDMIHESSLLNNIMLKSLQESNMDTHYTTDEGGKLKSFDEFSINRTDLTDVAEKAATPAVITMDFKGNTIHTALLGTGVATPNGATTVEMNSAKERALKRMAEFVSSFHGNNQQSLYTKG